MAVVAVSLLVVGVAGAIARPWQLPAWVFPVAAAITTVAVGVLGPVDAWDAVEPLLAPIAFLLLAVPLAVLLDELDVFHALARVAGGRHVAAGMWLVTAAAVAVLNLDAAVVLCTPLAITVARRWQLDPVAMAFQPALLACLASSALSVSNLTNLIAVDQGRLSPLELTAHMAVPTVVACLVGYLGWRFAFRDRQLVPAVRTRPSPTTARPLVIGGVVLTVLLVGFLAGGAAGVAPWVVVAVVDVALVGLVGRVPLEAVPWGTAAVAAGLAVVASAAADRAGLAHWLVHDGVWAQALSGAAGANLLNNLPAFLVALPHTSGSSQTIALLIGVNLGPVVLVTGSLAGLLWLESSRRAGLALGARDYARVGLVAGVPALLAAVGVLAATT
ncbi:MAG TPA: SLC13 family permease [Acidimicrobiales bacterium]